MTLLASISARVVGTALAVAASLSLASGALAQETQARAKERGKIVVGVKSDYVPFGYMNPVSKQVEGFEVDLAQDIANRLGVKLELVTVVTANRIQFLQQGKIDLLIATLSETPERREQLGIGKIPYYGTGGTFLTLKNSGLKDWEDLRGKPVCVGQGNIYGRTAATQYGADIQGFKSSADVLMALQARKCVASLNDETFAAALLRDPDWKDYHTPAATLIDPQPWVIAARKGDTEMVEYLDRVAQDWHKKGYIRELEKKWNIAKPSSLAADLHEKYKN